MKLMQFFVIFYAMRLTQECGSSIKQVKLVEGDDFKGTPDWENWELPPYNDDWWGFINLLGTREVKQVTTTAAVITTESNVENEEGFPEQWKGIGEPSKGFVPPKWAHVKEDVGQPSVCFSPPMKGNGKEWYLRWYYDYKRAKCRRFKYSGLGGNANKFISNVSCMEVCGQMMRMPCVPEGLFDYASFLKPNRRFVLVP